MGIGLPVLEALLVEVLAALGEGEGEREGEAPGDSEGVGVEDKEGEEEVVAGGVGEHEGVEDCEGVGGGDWVEGRDWVGGGGSTPPGRTTRMPACRLLKVEALHSLPSTGMSPNSSSVPPLQPVALPKS